MKNKIVTIVGTRPEIIKLSSIIQELEVSFDHYLIHTGQNYDKNLNEIFFADLNIKSPNFYLNIASADVFESIGNIIIKSGEILKKINPDAIVVYGDTNSCLSVIAAKRLKIPIFHMEAGNRCFDQRVPEEINRKIIDHLSDINFVVSEQARSYLIQEGIPQNKIIKTGSNMPEVLDNFSKKISNSEIIKNLNIRGNYFLLSLHREENVDDKNNLESILSAVKVISNKYKAKIIFPAHPRTLKRIKEFNLNSLLSDNFQIIDPQNFTDYIHLQKHCLCLLSDSGTVTEEASILNITSVTLRQTHERPEGTDYGTSILANISQKDISNSVNMAIRHKEENFLIKKLPDNKHLQVSKIVARTVQSYIHNINFYTWHKK